ENGRTRWQNAADRCAEEGRLTSLYEQAMTAINDHLWPEAEKLLGQIVAIRPSFQPGAESARKLHRTARWHSLVARFTQEAGVPPSQIHRSKLS
ncbi:MAG: hypothetical protein KC434_21065, partial [Anaerolineales bacterium]|nr:hypothetical protein [Anaerolineales bacterium]